MRAFAALLAALAIIPLAACDNSDPLGLYPEPAREVDAPLALTGRVVDAADALSDDQEIEISEKLAKIESATLAQLVVVTASDLQGYSIEDYSLALGRGWGIGDAQRNDGLLLVVAPTERKVRIEGGYGLEDTVEDPEAAKIVKEMLPYLRKGDMTAAIK